MYTSLYLGNEPRVKGLTRRGLTRSSTAGDRLSWTMKALGDWNSGRHSSLHATVYVRLWPSREPVWCLSEILNGEIIWDQECVRL